MKVQTLVDFETLALTLEQEQMALRFFAKIVSLVHGDEGAAGPDAGIALCVAMTEFLAVGIRSGIVNGHLSDERAHLLIGALSALLRKTS